MYCCTVLYGHGEIIVCVFMNVYRVLSVSATMYWLGVFFPCTHCTVYVLNDVYAGLLLFLVVRGILSTCMCCVWVVAVDSSITWIRTCVSSFLIWFGVDVFVIVVVFAQLTSRIAFDTWFCGSCHFYAFVRGFLLILPSLDFYFVLHLPNMTNIFKTFVCEFVYTVPSIATIIEHMQLFKITHIGPHNLLSSGEPPLMCMCNETNQISYQFAKITWNSLLLFCTRHIWSFILETFAINFNKAFSQLVWILWSFEMNQISIETIQQTHQHSFFALYSTTKIFKRKI